MSISDRKRSRKHVDKSKETPGQQLRQLRKEKDISVEVGAEATKISIKNIRAINSDVKSYLYHSKNSFDTIILDPPRIGANEILDTISTMTKNIIYVSCGPVWILEDDPILELKAAIQRLHPPDQPVIDRGQNIEQVSSIQIYNDGVLFSAENACPHV